MHERLLKLAEEWADHAYLRSCICCKDTSCYSVTVEDALSWCMFYLWASEHLDA